MGRPHRGGGCPVKAGFVFLIALLGSAIPHLSAQERSPGLQSARVREVLPGSGAVVLSLQPAPSGPALLPYLVKEKHLLDGVRPGDLVQVAFEETGNEEPVITRLIRSGSADKDVEPARALRAGDPLPMAGLQLQDADGRRFDSAALAGRPVLLAFFFTRCPQPDMCPLQSAKLAQVQAELPKHAGDSHSPLIISVTIDPAYDLPPVLKAYAQAYQARPESWIFLTGEKVEIRKLATRCGVEFWDEEGFPKHTLSLILADSQGKVIRLLPDHQWSVAQVIKEWLGPASP